MQLLAFRDQQYRGTNPYPEKQGIGGKTETQSLGSEVPQSYILTPADFHILFSGLDKSVISQIIKFANDTKIRGVLKTQRDVRIILTLTKWAQR